MDALFYTGGHVDPMEARISTIDVKRVAQMYPGTEKQIQDAKALDPRSTTTMWKQMYTRGMHEGIHWGHQILKTIKDVLIAPVLPDVVDKQLKPTTPAEERWTQWWPQWRSWSTAAQQNPPSGGEADPGHRRLAIFGQAPHQPRPS